MMKGRTIGRRIIGVLLAAGFMAASAAQAAEPAAAASGDIGTSHYADNDGVRIHYRKAGEGPLVVMIHGFPDYWYTWHGLMADLADRYTVAALDTRGYNLSDQPAGVENYAMEKLVGDVVAVIEAEEAQKASVIGHDWGGAIAWQVAAMRPDRVSHLTILNVPHPKGMARELATNADQQANSQYARDFQKPGSEDAITAEALARSVRDPALRSRYVAAFERSSFAGMMNYYRANYPGAPGTDALIDDMPQIAMPVLIIHGLDDRALAASGHNSTWEWVAADTSLLMIPGVGHWPHRDAPGLVNATIGSWLDLRSGP